MQVASLLFSLLAIAAPGVNAAECSTLLTERTRTDMTLPFEAFDQDQNGGWRALDKQGCPAEAAILIERYSFQYDSKVRILRWHLSQMHAISGNFPEAIATAEASINPRQEAQHPLFDWNDYVFATVAFLRSDRATFDRHHEFLRIATEKEPDNQRNLDVLQRLKACFGRPYKEAYSCNAP